jgi:hypothetical protein
MKAVIAEMGALQRGAKYTIFINTPTYQTPLADARGSDRSRDREGAESLEYATMFLKPRSKEHTTSRYRGRVTRYLEHPRMQPVRAREFGLWGPRRPNTSSPSTGLPARNQP